MMALIPKSTLFITSLLSQNKVKCSIRFLVGAKKQVYPSLNIKRSVLLIKKDLPSKKGTESAQRPSKLKPNDKTK